VNYLLTRPQLFARRWSQKIANPSRPGSRRLYELIKLRKLCAGDTPRARWIDGDERLLKNLFAAELPEELFRKVITFWAPVWK